MRGASVGAGVAVGSGEGVGSGLTVGSVDAVGSGLMVGSVDAAGAGVPAAEPAPQFIRRSDSAIPITAARRIIRFKISEPFFPGSFQFIYAEPIIYIIEEKNR